MGLREGGAAPIPRAWNVAGMRAEPRRAPKGHLIVCNDNINNCGAAAGEMLHG